MNDKLTAFEQEVIRKYGSSIQVDSYHQFYRYASGNFKATHANTPSSSSTNSDGIAFTLFVKSSKTSETITVLNVCLYTHIIPSYIYMQTYYKKKVLPNDSIISVKQQINKKIGAHIKLQQLSYSGVILKHDHQTLFHLHISKLDSIFLTINDKQITVCIKYENQNSVKLRLLTNTTIETVKKQINLRVNIPINQQILHFNERYLSNEHMLSYYDILEDVTLHLMIGPIPTPKPVNDMLIFIEIETIKTLTLTVNSCFTILNVKELIFEKESFEIHRQFLVFNEKELANERDLKYYHIESHSKLYLFLTIQQSENQNSPSPSPPPVNSPKKSIKNKKKYKKNKKKTHRNKKNKNRKNQKQHGTDRNNEVQKSKKEKTKKREQQQNKAMIVTGFERIDFGLGLYYESMNRSDYRNEYGVGKFIEWAEENGFSASEMDEEFEDTDDCSYVCFDDSFPLQHSYSDLECDEVKIYKILRHCHTHGYPPGYPVSKYVQKLNESLHKEKNKKNAPLPLVNPQKPTKISPISVVDNECKKVIDEEEGMELQWDLFYDHAECTLNNVWNERKYEILKKEQIYFNERYYKNEDNAFRELEIVLLDKLHIFNQCNDKNEIKECMDEHILQVNQLNHTQFYVEEEQSQSVQMREFKRTKKSFQMEPGIIHQIATKNGKNAWKNPLEKINVFVENEYLVLDFSPRVIKPTCCLFGYFGVFMEAENCAKSVKIEGSLDDGKNWKNLNAQYNECIYSLESNNKFFNQFRIMTTFNLVGRKLSDVLMLGAFEIYGYVKKMSQKELTRHYKYYRNEYVGLNRKNYEKEARMCELRRIIKDKDCEIEKVEKKQKEMKQKYDKLCVAKKKDFECLSKNKKKEMKELKVLYDREVSKHDKLKKKYEKKKIFVQELKNEKVEIENKNEQIQKRYDEMKVFVESVKCEKSELENKCEKMQKENEKMRIKCDEMSVKFDEIKREYDEMKNECKKWDDDKKDILFDLNAMQKYGEDTYTNYCELREKYDLQKEEMQKLNDEMELLREEKDVNMMKMQQKNKILEIKSKKIENKYRDLKIKYDAQRKRFGFLEWTTQNVAGFIVNIDYEKYAKYYDELLSNLMNEGVDGECLHNLEKADLHRFGIVDFKDKQNIINAIHELVRHKHENEAEG